MGANRAAEVEDLSLCAREPIHIPGSIQPHGVLLVLSRDDLQVVQHSANLGLLGIKEESVAGEGLDEIFGELDGRSLIDLLRALPAGEPTYVQNLHRAGNFSVSAHRSGGTVILEIEPAESSEDLTYRQLYPLVQSFLSRSKSTTSVEELSQLSVDHIRSITGFDRVLLYKFDPDWNGHVVAESRSEAYSSYFDLWFPASDIPEQARRLYTLNRFRSIVDARYRPVPIVPAENPSTHAPLDLTFSVLRSVSPVHIEYLKNMDVIASMSISILTQDSRLWGLIACHHRSPRHLPVEIRTACDYVAQNLAVQLQAGEERAEYRRRIELASRTSQLVELMAREENFIDGLLHHPGELLTYMNATGAAVLYEGQCTLLGETPTKEEVRALVEWLIETGRAEIYGTERLAADFPPAQHYADKASGLLAIPVSQIHNSYVLWFRPEVVRTVKWGGDPHNRVERNGAVGAPQLHPRKSFEAWSETVRGRSAPWSETEFEAAKQLRGAVVGVVLRKAEELAALSAELQRSNTELAAFSYSVSHDLRAPFRHIVGYSELLRKSKTAELGERDVRYVNTIIESAQFAGTLVDNLLSFSQVGRAILQLRRVDMGTLVADVRRDLELDYVGRTIEWRIGTLPVVQADHGMMRIVWQNLLHNAIKYTRQQAAAVIEVSCTESPLEYCFNVRDNGVGFDQAYADKLFGVFQRLHRMEDFEGTGIGLANVRRIVGRHGGRAWGEGEPEKGAAFFFTLPCQPVAQGVNGKSV